MIINEEDVFLELKAEVDYIIDWYDRTFCGDRYPATESEYNDLRNILFKINNFKTELQNCMYDALMRQEEPLRAWDREEKIERLEREEIKRKEEQDMGF